MTCFQFLVEKLCGVRVVITGEPVGCEDSTIILMNHRTRFDWLFIFSYILRHGPLRRFKISMKDILKYVPGPGNTPFFYKYYLIKTLIHLVYKPN